VAVDLAARYRDVRAATRGLCQHLSAEDMQLQSMADASPTKWHLAHTTWFFETFVLAPAGVAPLSPGYAYLFNSYYNGIGAQYPRAQRGLLSRPNAAEVWRYRAAVDEEVLALIAAGPPASLRATLELGLHHERQHQELILTDIKHAFAANPQAPRFAPEPAGEARKSAAPHHFRAFAGGRVSIGQSATAEAFAFDNEGPRHEVLLAPFALGSRLVTVGEYREFVADGGYRRPELWLSDGWSWREQEGVEAPLYWLAGDRLFTLHGVRALDDAEPVVHVSLYEADAYARWAGARLPREEELEVALAAEPPDGHFADSGRYHPLAGELQLFGDAWEWTQSSYSAYPGYAPAPGAIGEYNGKFMCNQHVLRGGSCATPRGHVRASYRNFFPAHTRWQFTSIRLARDP
jgi:ergothioneine biosynthesis protein EgtB